MKKRTLPTSRWRTLFATKKATRPNKKRSLATELFEVLKYGLGFPTKDAKELAYHELAHALAYPRRINFVIKKQSKTGLVNAFCRLDGRSTLEEKIHALTAPRHLSNGDKQMLRSLRAKKTKKKAAK